MIKRVLVQDLEPGMFVTDMNTPWLRRSLPSSGLVVRGPEDIERLLRAGTEAVWIDTARGRDSAKALSRAEVDREIDEGLRRDVEGAPGPEETERVPFEVEFRRARELYAQARAVVKREFDEVRRTRQVDGEATEGAVNDIVASIFRNRDAYLSLARLKSFDEYTFNHSLNVAVLSLNLAVALGILDRELLRLGVGAVLHDIGKVQLPEALVQKQGLLDPAEFEMVKTHPLRGAKLLLNARSVPDDCAAVPLGHHERYDGTGYPRSVSGAGVGKFGLIAGIADVYDAMTSDRPYQKGMPATRALRMLYGWAGTHFHPLYVQRFIQCVGIYPLGSVVRLDTGEVGVVVRQNRGELARPWVRLVASGHGGQLLCRGDADLRRPDPRGERPFARSVEAVLDPAVHGLDVDAVLAGAGNSNDPPAEPAAAG